MAAKVVDASAVAALLFNEPEGEHVAGLIDGHLLRAPNIIGFELANVCLKKIRRGLVEAPTLLDALRRGPALRIEERGVQQTEVVELARSKGLSAYDASYLWLARALELELITLDQKLARAAAAP